MQSVFNQVLLDVPHPFAELLRSVEGIYLLAERLCG